MRSGVIAQKVGMTRVFTETGEHIPVTVLKLGNCQVLGHRTTEKNGYVALQLGSGSRKTVYMPKAERGQFAAVSAPMTRDGDGTPVFDQNVATNIFSAGPDSHGWAVNGDGDYLIYHVTDVTPPTTRGWGRSHTVPATPRAISARPGYRNSHRGL